MFGLIGSVAAAIAVTAILGWLEDHGRIGPGSTMFLTSFSVATVVWILTATLAHSGVPLESMRDTLLVLPGLLLVVILVVRSMTKDML